MKGSFALLYAAAVAAAFMVHAPGTGVALAGTYANITVQGEAPGTEFDDWAGIPTLAMDPLDNEGGSPAFIDIQNVQIANNEDFLFIHISYHNTSSSGTLIAIDNDQNIATGYDIFGLGLIGSEIGYINDYPFSQTNGIFNTNVSFTGGPLGNGGALIFPFWDQDGMDKELAIPLDAFVTFPAGPAFPNPSMDIMIYADEGLGDITDVISYTLAEPPAGLPGDYNDDGTVDAADYVVYRKNEGTTETLPNDPHGGTIGANQYSTWRENFGEMGGGGSGLSNAAVPEPTTAGLLMATALMLGLTRRRF